jgi:anhydro-N-acetylmuramic acid kinase
MSKYRRKTVQSPRRRPPLAGLPDTPVIGAGIMSGTSADGIDVALVRFAPVRGGHSLRLLGFRTHPYPAGFRSLLLKTSDPATADLGDLSSLNVLVAELFSDALEGLVASLGMSLRDVGFIGSHGQTVCHLPAARRMFGRRVRSTLQIGHPSVIAKRTGVTTVGDFRPGDVALGGTGAPLVPLCDHLLYAAADINRAVLNIGGIANITILPAGCGLDSVIAFDTGPGNMPIDRLAERFFDAPFDRDGAIARRGKILPALLKQLSAHPYLALPPPKSTGREMFGDAFVSGIVRKFRGARKEDLVATVTEFTALSVYTACLLHVRRKDFPRELIVSGGGARNVHLLDALRRYFDPARVIVSDLTGIPSDAKEAVCFALLAWRTLRGEPGNLPSVTGASRPAVLGVICPP